MASAEIGCFVEELVDTLRDKRDVDLVRHANDGLRVVKSGVEERSSQYQDLIREITKKRDDARAALSAKENSAAHGAVMKERRAEYDGLNNELHANQSQQKENDTIMKALDGEAKEVRKEVKKAKQARNSAEATSSTLTLFKDISQIKWDYQADSIKGCMLDDEVEATPFEIDANMSQFEATNKLWELIGTR